MAPPKDWLSTFVEASPPTMGIDPKLLGGSPTLSTTVYQTAVTNALSVHRAGQGFQQISFDGEQAVVNKEWLQKCRSNHLNSGTTG